MDRNGEILRVPLSGGKPKAKIACALASPHSGVNTVAPLLRYRRALAPEGLASLI